MKTTITEQQKQIRQLSPMYLEQQAGANPGLRMVLKDFSKRLAPAPKIPLPPATLTELSEALRDPLPKPTAKPPCRDALEAFTAWKPLTMKMVSDLLNRQRAARDAILREYNDRTGQQAVYCEECDMGVKEEEVEEGWQTVVVPTKCEACDGLGVRVLGEKEAE